MIDPDWELLAEWCAARPAPRVLHVGTAILAWLKATARPTPTYLPNSLYGVPVVPDDQLTAGEWALHDGDQVIAQGNVGEPGRDTHYFPGIGFVTIPSNTDWGGVPPNVTQLPGPPSPPLPPNSGD